MKQSAQTSFTERIGRTLSRMWRGCARLDRKACVWLVAQGLPVAIAKALLWIVKLAVFGVLLYLAFWMKKGNLNSETATQVSVCTIKMTGGSTWVIPMIHSCVNSYSPANCFNYVFPVRKLAKRKPFEFRT